jgi:hypothetical protein
MPTRIMYIEPKSDENDLASTHARIGRVEYSRSGKSLHYDGRTFQTLAGRGFKANYFDTESGAYYWISGCKRRGNDSLYPITVEIDPDVREEYWLKVRKEPSQVSTTSFRCQGKYGGKQGRR